MIRRREEPQHHEQTYAEQQPRREAPPVADSEITVLGPGARLEGTIVSAGSLRIDGQIKGQVNADGDVMLSPSSQVEADIRAENATVAGQFKGNILVKGKAEVARGGRVDGNITCRSLVVQEGGILNGQTQMDQQTQSAPQSAASQQRTQAVDGAGASATGAQQPQPAAAQRGR